MFFAMLLHEVKYIMFIKYIRAPKTTPELLPNSMRALAMLQNVADADASLTLGATRRYPDLSLRQQRTGLASGKELEADNDRRRAVFLRPYTTHRFQWSGRGEGALALAGLPPFAGTPTSPQCPATPIGVGSRASPEKEAAPCAKSPLALSKRKTPSSSTSSSAHYAPLQPRRPSLMRSTSPAMHCANSPKSPARRYTMRNRTQAITATLDPAEVILARLHALAALLAVEEVVTAFAQLDTREQVAVFGLFESIAADVGTALARDAEVAHG
jgi:hypothetical protein